MSGSKNINIKDYISVKDYNKATSSIGNDWWYVRDLIEKSKDFPVYDIDIASIDFGVMPWNLKSIYDLVQHAIRINDCFLEHPVILSPTGWIMDGWHRVVKAVIQGEKTIKAVRFMELPMPEGTYKDGKE